MSLKASIVSGLLARFMTALGHLLLAPVYLHFLGPSEYGWVGVYLTVTALSALLDLGLSQALTREVAQSGGTAGAQPDLRGLVRTFELVFIVLAVVLCLIIGLGGPRFASTWLELDAVEPRRAAMIFALIGGGVAATFVSGMYVATLNGLHRQPLANALSLATFVVRSGGAALVLWLVAASATAMFAWQAAASLLGLIVLRACVFSLLPRGGPAGGRIRLMTLDRVKGFAAGIAGMNLVSGLAQQADKLVLMRLVPIAEFGVYALASQLMVGMQIVSSVFFVSLFPKFAGQGATRSDTTFRKGSQSLAVLAVSVPIVIAWRPVDVMLAWTGNWVVSERLSLVVALMMSAAAINATLVVPYTSLLAQGRVGAALRLTAIQTAIFLAALFPLAAAYGLEGAAFATLTGQVVLFTAYGLLIQLSRLGGGLLAWIRDWAPAAFAGMATGALSAWLIPPAQSRAIAVLVVVATLGIAVAASVLLSSTIRHEAAQVGKRVRRAMSS